MKLLLKNIVLSLKDFSLEVNVQLHARITAIFGPSGAGKTSLLDLWPDYAGHNPRSFNSTNAFSPILPKVSSCRLVFVVSVTYLRTWRCFHICLSVKTCSTGTNRKAM